MGVVGKWTWYTLFTFEIMCHEEGMNLFALSDYFWLFQKTETYCEASHEGSFFYGNSSNLCITDESGTCQASDETMTSFEKTADEVEPNTALLSAILMIGTFVIAYQLRSFKSGTFLGRPVS